MYRWPEKSHCEELRSRFSTEPIMERIKKEVKRGSLELKNDGEADEPTETKPAACRDTEWETKQWRKGNETTEENSNGGEQALQKVKFEYTAKTEFLTGLLHLCKNQQYQNSEEQQPSENTLCYHESLSRHNREGIRWYVDKDKSTLQKNHSKPKWQIRIEKQIEELRVELHRVNNFRIENTSCRSKNKIEMNMSTYFSIISIQ